MTNSGTKLPNPEHFLQSTGLSVIVQQHGPTFNHGRADLTSLPIHHKISVKLVASRDGGALVGCGMAGALVEIIELVEIVEPKMVN